jgi:hypothetical protein
MAGCALNASSTFCLLSFEWWWARLLVRRCEDVVPVLRSRPTPRTIGKDLYDKRARMIADEMRASAREHGCRFHRAWYARDGSAFYAVAHWETSEGASAFFEEWDIQDEPGEVKVILEGDVGLVPDP